MQIGNRNFEIGNHTYVMGILNVTPDSFYASSRVEGDALLVRAKAMLDAGASLVEIYSGFIYEGPGLVKRIIKHLEA